MRERGGGGLETQRAREKMVCACLGIYVYIYIEGRAWVWMKEGKRMGSRMKKMGVLFPTRSQLPRGEKRSEE